MIIYYAILISKILSIQSLPNTKLDVYEVPNWERLHANNGINNDCRFDENNICIGECPLTSSKCQSN